MPLLDAIRFATLAVLVANTLCVAGLIVLKAVNRSRRLRKEAAKSSHMRLISRHVSFDHCTDPIPDDAASDPAFLEALVDVRNALAGNELERLERIMDRHGVVDRQVAHLQAEFPRARRLQAAMALAELGGHSTAPVLVAHLDDREPEVRVQAARGLARMRWTPAIDEIVSRFGTETPWVRSRFADTLVGFGSAATGPLVAYVRINHRHETVGPVAAIRNLAAIGDDQAVRPLMELLGTDPATEVRIATIEALGLLANPMSAPALRAEARHADWRIRAKAATALGELRDTGSLDLLANSLTDPAWWVRRNSAAALAAIPGGTALLYEALSSADRFAADAAAEALVDMGELAASRQRQAEGSGGSRERALIGHMEARA